MVRIGQSFSTWMKLLFVILIALAITATLVMKAPLLTAMATDEQKQPTEKAAPPKEQPAQPAKQEARMSTLPKLVDLGAGKCIPCKKMAPILEELKKEYEGKLEVVFIDVWKTPDEAKKYDINLIPTQIFFDASGKEQFRHEGFFAKEDILAKWKELGVELKPAKAEK